MQWCPYIPFYHHDGCLWPFFLESDTPGQGSTRLFKAGCTISWLLMIWYIAACTPLNHVMEQSIYHVQYEACTSMSSMYQYVSIHTERWNDINSIYWYVLVHTGECTNLYIPVRTRTYVYSPFSVLLKKSAKLSWTRDLLHTSRRTYPYTMGVQTSTSDICCVVINVYITYNGHLSLQER